jgi:hypothetical protein
MEPTPGQKRTAAARAAIMRKREEKMAIVLRERGWMVVSPYEPKAQAGEQK